MKKALILIIFSCSSVMLFAQEAYTDFCKTMAFIDSVGNIAKQHFGDSSFQNQKIKPLFKELVVFNTKVASVSMNVIWIDFDESLQPVVEKLLVRYASEKEFYIQLAKPDENGFKQINIFRTKKSARKMFVLTKGFIIKDKLSLGIGYPGSADL